MKLVSLTLVTAPSVEPVSLATAKAHLRVEHNDEDDLISEYIASARQLCEDYCERSFINQYWTAAFDGFPMDGEAIELPRPRVTTIQTFVYDDTDDAEQAVSASIYNESLSTDQARLTLAQGEAWPEVGTTAAPVRVTFKSGYGAAASDVPPAIRQAIRETLEVLYRTRGAGELSPAIMSKLTPYKVMKVS